MGRCSLCRLKGHSWARALVKEMLAITMLSLDGDANWILLMVAAELRTHHMVEYVPHVDWLVIVHGRSYCQ